MMWLLGAVLAHAGERVVAHAGDTVESLAATLGDPALAPTIRALNGLEAGTPLVPGTLLLLPDRPGVTSTGGVVLSLYGRGALTLPGGAAAPVEVGTPLPEGSVVCTEADSYLTVRLAVASGGRWHDDVNLLGNTCLVIESAVAVAAGRSSVVEVQRGSVAVRSGDSAHPGTVTVRTAFGTTSGEGGGFRVHVEDAAARTEALYHPVAVFGAGQEQPVSAGEGSRVRRDEAPSAPVKLLVPGAPILPEDGAALRDPTFVWSAVDRSLGYRIELATSPDFAELVVVQNVAGDVWEPEMLLLPFRVPGLWWRVATYDRLGFLGIPSEERAVAFPGGVGP